MVFFSWIQNGGILNIQLDIVGFLAVLGEGAVLSNAQVAALSRITFLPRLMPAPQALLRPSRPEILAPHMGSVTGVHSGNHRTNINHVGHILVEAEHYKEYSVRCVRIIRKLGQKTHRRESKEIEDTIVTAKTHGPLTWVALTGCSCSVIIFAVAIWQHDGMAMLADLLLSLLSTVVALATKWKLNLPKRKMKTSHLPAGDVVIRYNKGSFLVVHCDEDVARELYFAPENIDYLVKSSWQYRMISLVGTVMLMFGVIFLGNAKTLLQLIFAGSYLIMNALYWIVAALPSRTHWDTSCFEVQEQCIERITSVDSGKDSMKEINVKHSVPEAHSLRHNIYVSENDTFTEALWRAIVVTKNVEWVKKSACAPDTPAWNDWLEKAELRAAESSSRLVDANNDGKKILMWELPDWNPGAALGECLRKHSKKSEKSISITPPPLGPIGTGADENV